MQRGAMNSEKMKTSDGLSSSATSSVGQVLDEEEEDYIDMELTNSPSSRFQSHSSPQSREFEFQMSSSVNKEAATTTTSPADELFYKGKLLPLHLPPRLQMVENLLQTSTIPKEKCGSIPLESYNISPSESCRVSCEINPDEYFFEWSSEMNSFIRNNHPKRSWSKKLKKSSLGQKLKASSVYIKSLFSKSGCTNEPSSCVKPEDDDSPKVSTKYLKVIRERLNQNPCKFNTLSKSIEREMAEEGYISQRRSFSGVIQWNLSSTKSLSPSSGSTSSSSGSSSSSSFSFGSNNGLHDLHFLKRSGSASSELEGSIEGAIAHCKMSHNQQLVSARKNISSEVIRQLKAQEC